MSDPAKMSGVRTPSTAIRTFENLTVSMRANIHPGGVVLHRPKVPPAAGHRLVILYDDTATALLRLLDGRGPLGAKPRWHRLRWLMLWRWRLVPPGR
jgi:hypothetical protein